MPFSQRILYANNAQTTLGSSLSSSATTITLATGQGAEFPNPSAGEAFLGTLSVSGTATDIPNEIVLVTERTGDTLTVVRAQEGSVALNWNVGDNFGNWNTAATMQQFAQFPDLQQQTTNSAVEAHPPANVNQGVITLSPAPLSYASLSGSPIRVYKVANNTGAYSLNVNGLGLVAVNYQGAALESGDLPINEWFEVLYDSNTSTFQLQTPPANGRGGPPSGVAGGALAGTYPNPSIANLAVTLGSPWLIQIPKPGGGVWIAQGGFIAGADDNEETVTFPTEFPNSCDWTGATLVASSKPASGIDGGCYTRIIDNTQLACGVLASGTGTITGMNWWAVGH